MSMPTTAYPHSAAPVPEAVPASEGMPAHAAYPPRPTPLAEANAAGKAGPREGLAEVIELFPETEAGLRRSEGDADPARSREPQVGAARARRASAAALHSLRRARRRWAVRVQLMRLWLGSRATGQHGMATAEYAIATLGAVAFAGLLVVIMRSDEVRGFLLGIIRAALAMP